MATANGTGDPQPEDNEQDADRTQRVPAGLVEVLDKWFPDMQSGTQADMRVHNDTARRMRRQHERGEPTTGRPGCPLLPFVLGVVAVWAVTR